MPPIPGPEQSALEADMRRRGFDASFPIVLYKGKILDGRHRYAAAMHVAKVAPDLGVSPVFREFDGDDDAALAFVVAANLHRRHLDASQRSAIAAEVANMQRGDNQHTVDRQVCRTSQADAAAMLNVSERSVRDAAKVKSADPDLHEKVKRGDVSVSKAAREVRERKKPPPRVQAAPKVRPLESVVNLSAITSWSALMEETARKRAAMILLTALGLTVEMSALVAVD